MSRLRRPKRRTKKKNSIDWQSVATDTIVGVIISIISMIIDRLLR